MTMQTEKKVVTCSLVAGKSGYNYAVEYCSGGERDCQCNGHKELREKVASEYVGWWIRADKAEKPAGKRSPAFSISVGVTVRGTVVSVDGSIVTMNNVGVAFKESRPRIGWRMAEKSDRWQWVATGTPPSIGDKVEVLHEDSSFTLSWRPVEAKEKQSNTVSAGERRRMAIAEAQNADERERMNEEIAA